MLYFITTVIIWFHRARLGQLDKVFFLHLHSFIPHREHFRTVEHFACPIDSDFYQFIPEAKQPICSKQVCF